MGTKQVKARVIAANNS